MKKHGLLLNSEMVKAVLDGTKTQTRTIIKPQPISVEKCQELTGAGYSFFSDTPNKWRIAGPVGVLLRESGIAENGMYEWKCPWQVGDLLYVREARCENEWGIFWKTEGSLKLQEVGVGAKWTPSIHMKKEDARIWLEITAIRVERVQDISIENIKAEGQTCGFCVAGNLDPPCSVCKRNWFKTFWNSIYPGSWERSDWVWVREFKRIEK